MISFDDNTTRRNRWKHDKYATFRQFFEAVNQSNGKLHNPSYYLAIDEILYPFRGRIGMKQYNPSKPAKYGLLYRSLCDAVVPYTYITLPYAGKPNDINNEAKKYYVCDTDGYTKYLVEEFTKINSIEGCNISMDQYFTSITIARWATDHKFMIVGTMKHNRKGIPKEFKTVDGREKLSTNFIHAQDSGDENIMLVSYVDKKTSGLKNVIALTTMHNDVRATKDSKLKSDILKFYDYAKGGVNIVDHISSHSSTRMKSAKWTINALTFVLDTIRINAYTIMRESCPDKKISTFEFFWLLGKSLIHVHRRFQNRHGLPANLVQKMMNVLGIKNIPGNIQHCQDAESVEGRCGVCVHGAKTSGNYKKAIHRLNHWLKVKCMKCKTFLCKNHQNNVAACPSCPNCVEISDSE